MNPICTDVAKGDSSTVWLFGHVNADGNQVNLASGYTCKVAVKGTAISRTITDRTADNLYYLVSLTAAEVATLTEGRVYEVGMQLENGSYTPALVQERVERIFVVANVVP